MIYLDNAATTSIEPMAAEFMHYISVCGNPSSIHRMGKNGRKLIDTAKELIKAYFNTSEGDIIFTSGGTEANNLAILGIAEYLKKIGKTTIITSKIEHLSVLNVCKELENRGFHVIYMPVCYDGRIDIEELDKIMCQNHDTLGLVSIQSVNSEIGTKQNIEDIGFLCTEYGALFHTDAVQAINQMKIDIDKCHIDMMSISGHKIGTPMGIGALYVRDKTLLSPIMFGGGQEYGLRSGTENLIGISAMAGAFYYLQSAFDVNQKIITSLRAYMIEKIDEHMTVPYYINCFDGSNHLISLTIPKVEGNSLMLMLNENGICVSTGSACSANKLESSYVLKAIGIDDKEAICTIRISLSHHNTNEEIEIAARKIAELSAKLYELI